MRRPLIVFVLGAWGAGKSSLGRGLALRGFLHVEIDRWSEGDGIDLAGLRAEWDIFAASAWIVPLVNHLAARAAQRGHAAIVLTFPNLLVLTPRHLAAIERAGVRLLIPYATAAECMEGWLARERAHARAADAERWIAHNALPYARFSAPEHAGHRLASFLDGAFIGAEALAAAALARLDGSDRASGADVPRVRAVGP